MITDLRAPETERRVIRREDEVIAAVWRSTSIEEACSRQMLGSDAAIVAARRTEKLNPKFDGGSSVSH